MIRYIYNKRLYFKIIKCDDRVFCTNMFIVYIMYFLVNEGVSSFLIKLHSLLRKVVLLSYTSKLK